MKQITQLRWVDLRFRLSQFALASTEHTQDTVCFRYVGELSPFPPKYLLPTAAVIDIVAYIYRTRELPTWVQWEQRLAQA